MIAQNVEKSKVIIENSCHCTAKSCWHQNL